MQIVKTMQVKVVSIGPGKLRPTNESIKAARSEAMGNPGKAPTSPVITESKDCIQAVLAVVDANGRYMNRTTLSFCEGKMVVDNTEVGSVPDALNLALSTVFDEISKVVSSLNSDGKLPL